MGTRSATMIDGRHLTTKNPSNPAGLTHWIDPMFYIELQTTAKPSTSERLNTMPCNIIFFPSQLCRKVGVTRKLTARIPQMAGLSILRLPQGPAQAPEELRGLFAETREILIRRSGVRAAMAVPCREFSSAPDFPHTHRSEPHCALKPANSFEVVGQTAGVAGQPATRNPVSQSIVESQMAALFELKRNERPPENFLSDFIEEFHRRNDAIRPTPRRSASGKKGRQD